MDNSLRGNSSLRGLLTGGEGGEFTMNGVGNLSAYRLVVQIAVCCQECANNVLFDGILDIIELCWRCTALRDVGCRVVVVVSVFAS